MLKTLKLLIQVIIISTLWSCANRIPPTGGPRDEEPPVLINTNPIHGSINVSEQNLEIEFNELVILKNIKEELIITPRIDVEYTTKFIKNKVIINLEEPLPDSTTYTFNFRQGVVDITESNPAEDLILAFSTGDMLDTLSIEGIIVDLYTQQPIKDIVVGLYEKNDTLDIFNSPPLYFAKSKQDGSYKFRNVKDGVYKVYALEDANKNLICQPNLERYGFIVDEIKLDTAITDIDIPLQYLDVSEFNILRARQVGQYFNIVTKKYINSTKFTLETNDSIIYSYEENRREIKIYNTFDIKDSLKVIASLTDSIGQIAEDTFYLSYKKNERSYDEFTSNIISSNSDMTTKTYSFELEFSKPIIKTNLDSIYIKQDSLTLHSINDYNPEWNNTKTNLKFSIPIAQAMKDSIQRAIQNTDGKKSRIPFYEFVAKKGAFLSIEKDTSDTMKQKILIIDPATKSQLNGSITTDYNNYIIQIISISNEMVQELINPTELNFNNLEPGQYKIRILIDENDDGVWSAGNILNNIEPEPVIIYVDKNDVNTTSLRANWEVTTNIEF